MRAFIAKDLLQGLPEGYNPMDCINNFFLEDMILSKEDKYIRRDLVFEIGVYPILLNSNHSILTVFNNKNFRFSIAEEPVPFPEINNFLGEAFKMIKEKKEIEAEPKMVGFIKLKHILVIFQKIQLCEPEIAEPLKFVPFSDVLADKLDTISKNLYPFIKEVV